MPTEMSHIDPKLQVGKVMEVTREESMILRECAQHMYTSSQKMRKGWLMEYVRAHKAAHGVFQSIIKRSHAN